MSWAPSLLVAVLSGVLGLIVSGFVTATVSMWLQVSNREGAAGYLMIAMGLIGGVAGFLIGIVAGRVVAGMAAPGFLKALGMSSCVIVALGGVVLLVGWLRADFAPEIDGKALALAIEVRCPKGFEMPKELDEFGAYACVRIPGSRRYQQQGRLDIGHPIKLDGRWIVTAVVPLHTSSANKVLDVRFAKGADPTFWLPLRRHPKRSDLEWGPWLDSGWDAGTPEPPKEQKFSLRYKVQLVDPPPPPQDPAEVRAREFAALKPDAPLGEWLPFLFEDPDADRTRTVVERINTRQGELAILLSSPDAETRERAFRAVDYANLPSDEVKEAVLAEGRAIADGIRKSNQRPENDPGLLDEQHDLSTRFKYWKQAWWVVHQRLGVDGRPPVQEIHDLAMVRARGTVMAEIEINARVILEALNKKAPEERP